MERKNIFYVMAQKFGCNKHRLKDFKINGGKILRTYFESVLSQLSRDIFDNKVNRDAVDEFSGKSKDPMRYINPEATLFNFATLLKSASSRTNATLRSYCTKPAITKRLLLLILAEQLEVAPAKIRITDNVRSLTLPFTGHDKHSWVTLFLWMEAMFGKDPKTSYDWDEIAELTIDQLLSRWATV